MQLRISRWIFLRPAAMLGNADWYGECAEFAVSEERTLGRIKKIVLEGHLDVVLRRAEKPTLFVAAGAIDVIASVLTEIKSGVLVVEREGLVTKSFGSQMIFNGPVGQITSGDIVNGVPMGARITQGKAIVGIGLPEVPVIQVKGSGNVTLLDLQ